MNLVLDIDGQPWIPTKAVTQVSPEKQINTLTIVVCDESTGQVEMVKTINTVDSESSSISFSAKAGSKDVYVYANYIPDFSSYSVYHGCELASSGFSENSWSNSNFIMRGIGSYSSLTSGGTKTISISLFRVVRRTTIARINNYLPNGLSLSIYGAYLSNVYTKDSFNECDSDPSFWANKWGRNLSGTVPYGLENWSTLEYQDLTVLKLSSPQYIANGSSWTPTFNATEKGMRFYSMPNVSTYNPGTAYDISDSWSPRYTRLVIVAGISGNICYYPIILNSFQSTNNKSVDYTVSINGVGVDDPEVNSNVSGFDISFNIAPWEAGATYTENSLPPYKPVTFTRQSGHISSTHVAQRMYLEMSVADQKESVKPGFTFGAVLTKSDGTTEDVTSWISSSYDSSSEKYLLNIACRKAGTLTVKGLYGAYVVGTKDFNVFEPVCIPSVSNLLLTGGAQPISYIWYDSSQTNVITSGNTTTNTDGTYFDSSLYSSCLGDRTNSIEFDTSYSSAYSMLGNYTSSGIRYLRVASFGSGAMATWLNVGEYGAQSDYPVIGRFRMTTPSGITSQWCDVCIVNFWGRCASVNHVRISGSSLGYSQLRSAEYIDINMPGSLLSLGTCILSSYSPVFTWEWDYNNNGSFKFGNGNTSPLASGKYSIYTSSVTGDVYSINLQVSSSSYTNGAGHSTVWASLTNSVSGESLKLPVCDVMIFKDFYYGVSFNSGVTRDIYYWYPDLSSYSDVTNPVAVPDWTNLALNHGATQEVSASGYYGYADTYFGTTTSQLSKNWSSSAMFNSPEKTGGNYFHYDSGGNTYFYRFHPAYDSDNDILHTASENH